VLVGRIVTSLRKSVYVEIEQAKPLQVRKPGLLIDLPPLGSDNVPIVRFDMAARLEPKSKFAMEDQENGTAIRRENESAGSDVARIEVHP